MDPDDSQIMKGQTGGFIARLARDRGGNAMPLLAAAIIPLLAMIGGGIDMGRSYLSQSRLQQACDAGVLAARKKLGSTVVSTGVIPADVEATGDSFFNVNFRDGAYGSEDRTFAMTLDDDHSISGVATATVPTSVMQVFGYAEVDLAVDCQARLNFSNTDVMMVLDTTGSMNSTNPSDASPRIDIMKSVVRNFHSQIEGNKGPGTRVRYGFVPYATNVNVGGLLEDDWVVSDWTYQSREDFGTEVGDVSDYTYNDNWVYISGSNNTTSAWGGLATYHPASGESGADYWSCDMSPPASTYTANSVELSTVTEPYVGPPAGTKTTVHYRSTYNGDYFYIERVGVACLIKRTRYTNYVEEYDQITIPYTNTIQKYRYAPIAKDVSNWRSETSGCIEERSTYEVADWSNVDLSQAIDLDLDRIPTATNPDTQWRPMYPGVIHERSLDWYGTSGSFTPDQVVTTDPYFFMPSNYAGLVACPAAASKLAEMDADDVNDYLGTISASGQTYHDIGMIWGGRLLSPTGLFSAENVDVDSKPTSRHLIFLTDGETEPLDIAYGAYGVEPLDQRRWSQSSTLNLTETVEARFAFACEEVKKKNVTVWVIGFGVSLNPVMTDCAGSGHFFEASNASQLNDVFSKIAAAMGDLRIGK
jgi:hypothetical protein